MIHIGKIKKSRKGDKAILENNIAIDGDSRKLWFSVDEKYYDYLCDERADAYLVACLHYSMSNNHDIETEDPISEQLLFNINTYLIPALIENNPDYHFPDIKAEIAFEPLPNAGAVGTGISCGVDSLHAVSTKTGTEYKNLNITHLCFNNVGSHGEGEKARKLYLARLERPKKFAEEFGFEFVASDSNLMDVIEQNHFRTHTYSSMFPVLCLQKLYSTYFYASSGYKFNEFNLRHTNRSCCGSYELLSLPSFSTGTCHIMSDGMGSTRLMKLKEVINYRPSYKYLNVCLKEGDNCSRCEKCVRTLLGLDSLGALDKYTDVFDVEYYKSHRNWYLQQMLYRIKDKKHDYFEMYPYFKKDVTLWMYAKSIAYGVKVAIRSQIYNLLSKNPKLFNFSKEYYHKHFVSE